MPTLVINAAHPGVIGRYINSLSYVGLSLATIAMIHQWALSFPGPIVATMAMVVLGRILFQ